MKARSWGSSQKAIRTADANSDGDGELDKGEAKELVAMLWREAMAEKKSISWQLISLR